MGQEINGTETHGLVLIGLGSPLMTGIKCRLTRINGSIRLYYINRL